MKAFIEKLKSTKVNAMAALAIAVVTGICGSVYAYAVGGGNLFPEGSIIAGDDAYKEENGKVYEYDDGRWEEERDKKVENGKVYEYDDGRWEEETDKKVQGGTVYDNDYDDDYDDWDDDWDDHDDYDDDWDDDDD